MGGRRPKVLIVEDDDALALSLHRALYEANDRFILIAVKTGEVGREIMSEMTVDVLVTDLNLGGMSGLDLVYWAAIESPATHYVVISDANTPHIRDKACAFGCLRLLTKPVDGPTLRATVLEALDSREKLSGQLSALSAVDLIQMLCLGRRSVTVRITAQETIGSFLIQEGRLVHAVWDGKTGEAAIREIVAVGDGLFRTSPLPDGFERTIHRDWAHVVMDAARALDERAELPVEPGTWPTIRADERAVDVVFEAIRPSMVPQARGESSPPRSSNDPAHAAAALVDKGFAALRRGDIEQARACWEAAQRLAPDNRSIELNLRKLEAIRPRPPDG